MTAITKDLANCILDLARDSSSQGRGALLNAITDLYEKTEYSQSDAERELMVDILGQLVGDIETAVRRDLAERLSANDHAPRELIVMLANDAIEVAKPILLQSAVLEDPDLVEIVRQRTAEHRLTVATRASVSEPVSDALVGSGDEDAIETLLRNPRAEISRVASEYLVAESQKVDRFQKPLLARADLPADLAHRMFWWVSAALRRYIVENFEVEVEGLDGEIEQAVQAMAKEPAHFGRRPSHAEQLVARLVDLGEFNELFLVQSLRHQHVSVFIAGIAHMAGVDMSMARRIIFDKGGEALTLTCKAIGMDRANFAAVFLRIRKAVGNGEAIQPALLERMLGVYDKMSQAKAMSILRLWQQDAPIVAAVIPPGLVASAT
jgi:uncharacterized protein (DUF2336 family)